MLNQQSTEGTRIFFCFMLNQQSYSSIRSIRNVALAPHPSCHVKNFLEKYKNFFGSRFFFVFGFGAEKCSLLHHPSLLKKLTFFTLDTHTCVCVTGGRKCYFLGNFFARTK